MNSNNDNPKCSELIEFLLLFSSRYLASGGPTSRLEENLTNLGGLYGWHTEVFSTPTGVFVCLEKPGQDSRTSLVRIKDTGNNLGELSELEALITSLLKKNTTLSEATAKITNPAFRKDKYGNFVISLAAMFLGFALSFSTYQRLSAALISGGIALSTWAVSNFFFKPVIANPILTDFLAAFWALSLAAVAHGMFSPISIEAYALGGIVLLVPGLALTTAIAELAEQNLVSGTAKLMQALMTLFSLGLSYLLFQQIAAALQIRDILSPTLVPQISIWFSFFGFFINVICFSIILKVPRASLFWCCISGFSGWVIIKFLADTPVAAASAFLASLSVGLMSLFFGRLFSQPSQMYSIPGILSMLPGMLALDSFRYFASGNDQSGVAFSVKVAITAVSIVFGLLSARIPFQIMRSANETYISLRGKRAQAKR
ncbi:MAG: threonine/serine exporter family protein [Oligoflexia bacterium]|nr:threonine/serine exporter family protein [Oligoflexia bacterium]